MDESIFTTLKPEDIPSTQPEKRLITDFKNLLISDANSTTNFLHQIPATNLLNGVSNNELMINVTDNLGRIYNSSQTTETENGNITVFSDYPEELLHFAAVCFIAFAVVGAIGNFTSILALSMSKKTRNATTAFIVNLCVADFLFCSLPMPISAMTFIEKRWNYGNVLCILFSFVRYSNGAVSLFSVIAITVNRYILIAYPRVYDLIYTKRKIAFMICFMWMFSMVFLLLPCLEVWGKLGYDPKVGTCTILAVDGKSPKTFFFFAAFLLPSIVFIVCYSRIYFVVRKGSKRTKRKEDKLSSASLKRGISKKSSGFSDVILNQIQYRNKKELKVLQVMLVVFTLFVLCYFPAFFVKVFKKENDFPTLNVIGYLGVYFSNIINPFVYIVMSDVYRKAYKELFCRRNAYNDSHCSASVRYCVPHQYKT